MQGTKGLTYFVSPSYPEEKKFCNIWHLVAEAGISVQVKQVALAFAENHEWKKTFLFGYSDKQAQFWATVSNLHVVRLPDSRHYTQPN